MKRLCPLKNDQDLLLFFTTAHINWAQDASGKKYRSLAEMDELKKYSLSYSTPGIIDKTAASSFIDNSFKGRANCAVVKELLRLGHKDVRIICTSEKVYVAGLKAGEFDGIIGSDTHLFVVEAKLHAKSFDVPIVHQKILLLKHPECDVIKVNDPRLSNVIGILATSSPLTAELEVALRDSPRSTWLLAANGYDLELSGPKNSALTEHLVL